MQLFESSRGLGREALSNQRVEWGVLSPSEAVQSAGGNPLDRRDSEVAGALHVFRLGKHIQRGDRNELVGASVTQFGQVSAKRGRMTGKINDLMGAVGFQGVQEIEGASPARRIQDNAGLGCFILMDHLADGFFRGGGDELAIDSIALNGVFPSRLNGFLINLHAGKPFDEIPHFKAEEACPAIEVEKVGGAGVAEESSNGGHHLGEEVIVDLKKRVGWQDPIIGHHPEIELDPVLSWGILPDGLKLLVQRGFRDMAMVHIYDESIIVAEETDAHSLRSLAVLGAHENPVPIAVGSWRGDRRFNGRIGKSSDSFEEID